MTDDDFEAKLKALLNEHVDAKVGAPRPAPHFDTDRVARVAPAGPRRRAPWITPLIAAACVVAVVGGGIGASQLVADKGDKAVDRPTVTSHPRPTHTPTPTPSVPAPTPTSKKVVPGPHGTNHGTPSTTTSTTTAPAGPAPTFTTVDGARIAVPHGWTLTSSKYYQYPGFGQGRAYCISPPGLQDTCPINLYRFSPPSVPEQGFLGIDVDSNGFDFGNPPDYLCSEQPLINDSVTEIAQDSTFGGRAADFRQWTRTCKGKVVTHEIQSMVATDPGWALYSGDAEQRDDKITFAQVQAAFAVVTQQSVLPAATSPVRFMDRGIITGISRSASDVTVTIDRVLRTEQGHDLVYVNQVHTTYSYRVPTTLYDRAKVKVGDRVGLTTGGVRVTVLVKDT